MIDQEERKKYELIIMFIKYKTNNTILFYDVKATNKQKIYTIKAEKEASEKM